MRLFVASYDILLIIIIPVSWLLCQAVPSHCSGVLHGLGSCAVTSLVDKTHATRNRRAKTILPWGVDRVLSTWTGSAWSGHPLYRYISPRLLWYTTSAVHGSVVAGALRPPFSTCIEFLTLINSLRYWHGEETRMCDEKRALRHLIAYLLSARF